MASRLLMARMPVSGVRTSCANAASAASTMPGASPRSCALPRVSGRAFWPWRFGTRFFGGCLPVGRVVRRSARFCRHDPRYPTRAPEWHARATGVTVAFLAYPPQNYGNPTRRRISAGGRACRAQFAQGPWRWSISKAFARRHPGPAGDAGRPAADSTKQVLQQAMHAGRPEQVLAAHHVGDALQGVVDHDRQMVAGRRLLAREDDVAPGLRPAVTVPCSPLGPSPCSVQARCWPGPRAGRRHVEPQRVGRALPDQPLGAHPATAISPRPDKAARRRDRAAKLRPPSRSATRRAISARLSKAG